MKRRRGLGWRLAIAFALVAAATALLAAATLTVAWQRQFEGYVRQGLQEQASYVASALGQEYAVSGSWFGVPFDAIAHTSMMTGRRIQIFDATGKMWLDSGPNPQLRQLEPEALTNLTAATGNLAVTADINAGGRRIGLVRVVSQASSGFLTERDVSFQRASLMALVLAAVLAVAFAGAAGVIYARSIVRPIDRVTATAAALSAGKRDARTGMGGEDPVGVLGRTLDAMADSIEADRQFERRLTADVAHELRTPLQAIQATVEAMQDGVLPADESRLETVRNETRRLARLTESILELSRLERGADPFEMRPMDPADALAMALDTHRVLIEAAGLVLSEDAEHGLVMMGDRDRLTQAFGNLLSNAARYTPSGGSVTVSLHGEGNEAVVSVADTGIGIAHEDRERVFTRFWRADAARSRATGGIGVGLSVLREIVDRHGGRVSVSDVAGGGTQFAVRLPLLVAPAPNAPGRRSFGPGA